MTASSKLGKLSLKLVVVFLLAVGLVVGLLQGLVVQVSGLTGRASGLIEMILIVLWVLYLRSHREAML